MRIKKYEATTMQEALTLVKTDFGSDAVILHSRSISKGGIFGFFAKEIVEVMAGVDINILEDKRELSQPGNASGFRNTLHRSITESGSALTEPKTEMLASPQLARKVEKVESEIEVIKETLQILVDHVIGEKQAKQHDLPNEVIEYVRNCENIGLDRELLFKIFRDIRPQFTDAELSERSKVYPVLKKRLIDMLGSVYPIVLEPGRQKMIALLGPTGVGKTTTAAKIAANFALMQQKKVGLITIDTFRIAAIEQLKTYAAIIGIPIEVAFTPKDFLEAQEKLRDRDLIIIDTAGRSLKNEKQADELKQFLHNSSIESILVLSATAKNIDTDSVISRFSSLCQERVIFTKLDETHSLGIISNVIAKYHFKLSYYANGQNVPDDLEIAEPKILIDMMLVDVMGGI